MAPTLLTAFRRRVAVLAVTGLVGTSLAGVTLPAAADTQPTEPGEPVTVAADSLPTVQVDGVVWDQQIVGNTVYVVGEFTTARPAGAAPGTSTVPRANMLAYDVRTGVLVGSFAPAFNGSVRSVSATPDGRMLVVGGAFTAVTIPATMPGVTGQQTRWRVAAFDAATGALVTGFQPVFNGQVAAVEATDTTIYMGGIFTEVSGNQRTRAVAVSRANGAVQQFSAAIPDGQVSAFAISPDRSQVVLGGSFTSVNGSSNPGMGLARLDAASGANLPLSVNGVIRNGGVEGAITSLKYDGQRFYGSGYTFGRAGGNLEGVFAADWATGQLVWMEDCHGDTYDIHPRNGVVYAVSHAHYCGNVGGYPQTNPWTAYYATAFTNAATRTITADPHGYFNFAGQPGADLLNFFPSMLPGTFTGQDQAAWTVTGNDQYVVYGGEFTFVNNVRQQGLARMAVREAAPNKQGPRLAGAAFNPRVASFAPGKVSVTWPTNYDRDNERLVYRVQRDDASTTVTETALVHEQTVTGRFWETPALGFVDETAAPGKAFRYRVQAVDPYDNRSTSDWVTFTVPTGDPRNAYGRAVLADGPSGFWRFDEATGRALDWAGVQDMDVKTGVTRGTAGALVGEATTAANFGGASTGYTATQVPVAGPQTFSVEAWFRTTTTRGGKIIGFGDEPVGASRNYDRHVYMDNTGRIWFGVRQGTSNRTLNSTAAFNNGQWHHVVATLGSGGMQLFVDGVQVGQRTDTTSAQPLAAGWWKVGGDNLSGWTSRPTSNYLAGALDEVAVYPTALTTTQVTSHYDVGRGLRPTNAAPTAAFTSSADRLALAVDGTSSSDPDGTVTGYGWQFGDGGTATGATASHTYAAPGTYRVNLTVTDDRGGTATVSRDVTVTVPPPNSAPTAAFTAAVTDLALTVNGSGSTDPDGRVASWAWQFGDGTTGTGAQATHTYAAAGTYPVTLTVTDDDGATSSTTKNVTATVPPGPPVLAADVFGRTVTGGWGSADRGGAWTLSATTPNYAVTGGVGTQRLNLAGATVASYLTGPSSTTTDLSTTVALDKAATGGGVYVSVIGRRVGTTGDYRAKLRFLGDGRVSVGAYRSASGTDTQIGTVPFVPDVTYAAGDQLRVRVAVTGVSPTTVRIKVWRAGTPEPATWLVDRTDSTAGLQAPGGIGLLSYLSGTSTNAPLFTRFDDLQAFGAG
jgi:PKD repeat protein